MEPSFADRLTDWLRFLRVRPADLARALDLSRAAVTGWTTGTASPSMDRVTQIVGALRIEGGVAEFFSRMPSADRGLIEARERARLENEEVEPHPRTGEVTREIDMRALTAGGDDEAA